MNKIKKIFCNIFKIECCPQCESMNFEAGFYTRGWNNSCKQAYGDKGKRCFDCGYIAWNVSLIKHVQIIPKWCEPYN